MTHFNYSNDYSFVQLVGRDEPKYIKVDKKNKNDIDLINFMKNHGVKVNMIFYEFLDNTTKFLAFCYLVYFVLIESKRGRKHKL